MAKYYTYEGKPVGFIRKMVDDVVLLESGWTGAVNQHFAKKGYDTLLAPIAQILVDAGHPPITRAQAWLILHDMTNKGVPEALKNVETDEKVGLGKLFSDSLQSSKNAGAAVVDTAVSAGKTVGGAVVSVGKGKRSNSAEGDESDSE